MFRIQKYDQDETRQVTAGQKFLQQLCSSEAGKGSESAILTAKGVQSVGPGRPAMELKPTLSSRKNIAPPKLLYKRIDTTRTDSGAILNVQTDKASAQLKQERQELVILDLETSSSHSTEQWLSSDPAALAKATNPLSDGKVQLWRLNCFRFGQPLPTASIPKSETPEQSIIERHLNFCRPLPLPMTQKPLSVIFLRPVKARKFSQSSMVSSSNSNSSKSDICSFLSIKAPGKITFNFGILICNLGFSNSRLNKPILIRLDVNFHTGTRHFLGLRRLNAFVAKDLIPAESA
nr:hypothetical protein Iba_chr14aCG4560 [Ipomoea batatas]